MNYDFVVKKKHVPDYGTFGKLGFKKKSTFSCSPAHNIFKLRTRTVNRRFTTEYDNVEVSHKKIFENLCHVRTFSGARQIFSNRYYRPAGEKPSLFFLTSRKISF